MYIHVIHLSIHHLFIHLDITYIYFSDIYDYTSNSHLHISLCLFVNVCTYKYL